MSNTAGIYIKVGDDSVVDYATKYLSDLPDYQVWPDQEVLAWLIRSIEGLYTYHEERQREATDPALQQAMWAEEMAGIEYTNERKKDFSEDIESRKAQGWRFAPEIDQA